MLELFNIVEGQGFIPIAAATLVGQHTYGNIQVGRPDHDDMYRDELFGSLVRLKINKDNFSFVSIPGHYPYREGGNGGKFRPSTNENCTQCGLCVKNARCKLLIQRIVKRLMISVYLALDVLEFVQCKLKLWIMIKIINSLLRNLLKNYQNVKKMNILYNK
ncbi:hypothetical protein SD457_19040 [Coprobacillaceae bacterium CR2/5/TPMF4]|nr:hypothetical protein SD457_19040 [Coprobacillaceae bacterium CR2/5/TPMF4]